MFRLTRADKDWQTSRAKLISLQVKHRGFSSLLELQIQHINQRSKYSFVCHFQSNHIAPERTWKSSSFWIYSVVTNRYVDQYISASDKVTRCFSKLAQRIIWVGKRAMFLSDYLESILQSSEVQMVKLPEFKKKKKKKYLLRHKWLWLGKECSQDHVRENP